jgi:hypothetical protein
VNATEAWLLDEGVYLRPVIHRKQIVDFINELGLEGNRVKRIEISPDHLTVTYFYKEETAGHSHFVLSLDREGPLIYQAVFAILPDDAPTQTEEIDHASD